MPQGAHPFHLQDPTNQQLAVVFPFGVQLVGAAEIPSLLQDTFNNPTGGGTAPETSYWTLTPAAGGTAVINNGQVDLATNGLANASIIMESTFPARSSAALVNGLIAQLAIPDGGTVNNRRRWGVFNANDGYFFELNGSTLAVGSKKGGVDTVITQPNWNGNADGRQFVLNPFVSLWEIYYSGVFVWFTINRSMVHMLHISNPAMASRVNVEVLPIRIENVNSGGLAQNLLISCDTVAITRIGPSASVPRFTHFSAAGTTILRHAATHLYRVTVGTLAGGASTIDVYDDVAAVAANKILSVNGNGSIGTFEINIETARGLTVVITGTPDFVIVYD